MLAELFEGTESLTPYGGRAVSWEPVGSAWLKTGPRRLRDRSEPGGTRVLETMTAEARADARLSSGGVLRFGGADWRIRSSETVGGQAILNLERVS
ncbi:MAG: phage head-tail adapter protein [Brevundimonas sp.]|uniref:phage head-tail adapter protein n=1 Tax=Brevundimonas sp. TaxID=1871086 RepID=UPI00261882D2|nr:phage head-tail adapter protein [Brevundimonas sp.]MDI6623798.1 phage head-tail adapter protein [Brevundimonas sp.]MDQ7812633.1 phage head-tail adapter protein [Brevundimonas sp.]